jgi:hypothetical protein
MAWSTKPISQSNQASAIACYKQVGHGKSIKQKKYQMPKLGHVDEIHMQKN